MNELEIENEMLRKQIYYKDMVIRGLRIEIEKLCQILSKKRILDNVPCVPFSLAHPGVTLPPFPFGFSVSKHPPVSHPCQLQKLGSSAPASNPVSNDLDRDTKEPWVCAKCYAVMLNNEANCVRCGGAYYFSNNPEGKRNIYP